MLDKPETDIESYEMNAFLNALAISFILNRTLVLNPFTCGKRSCFLDEMLDVDVFSEHFSFRESSFLRNPRNEELAKKKLEFNFVWKMKLFGTPDTLTKNIAVKNNACGASGKNQNLRRI